MVSPAEMPSQNEVEQLIALFNAGRYVELERQAQLLVERFPMSGRAWKILGTALGVQGKNALSAMQQAAQLSPNDASVHNNLGNAWQDQGELVAAADSYRRALEIDPNFAVAYNNLGKTQCCQGHSKLAVANYRQAIKLEPNYVDAYYNLGNALQNLRCFAEAQDIYRLGLTLAPNDAQMYYNLGAVLKHLGKIDEATAAYRSALALKSDFAEAHNNLGNMLLELKQYEAAVGEYRRTLDLNSGYAEAHNNLGYAMQCLGDHSSALASYRRALAIKPDYIDAHSNLLFALNYASSHATASHLEEAHRYGQTVAQQATVFTAWTCTTQPTRLRVGIVSGDLCKHPVSYALESLLEQIDATRIELITYPTNAKTDELTERLQRHFAAWHPIYGKSDQEAAQLIHADGVHILLDLSGHTAHNRLPVFAWKPAPVQASWLGYFATTGVAEMDYLMTSAVAVPEAHRTHFTESVWHLPDIWLCFTPPDLELAVSPLPAHRNGYLTYGCFQRLDKISDAALNAWGKILAANPRAKLLLANKELGTPSIAAQFTQRLQQQGIDPARVELQGAANTRADYLARYRTVDLILDSFPYPGVTTTCEALWMGVPTLTLAGETLLSRQGAGMLVPAGLSEWVAHSEDEYVAKAIELTGDLNQLAQLRANLRQQVLASPVYDAPRFARNFETALWDMWRNRA